MSDKYYRVFYTKDVKKKHKVFNEGVIACLGKKTKIFNQDGQCIFTCSQKIQQLEPGSDFMLGFKYYVTVQQEVSQQKFKSGKAFMVESLPIKSFKTYANKKKTQNQSKDKVNQQRKLIRLQSGIQVEHCLHQKLRPHQIEGINFMFQCLSGKRGSLITGCILADFMGLGKTLQTLALTYSILRMKIINKSIVVCPLTLVSVWKRQCQKWLGTKLNPTVCLGDGSQVTKVVNQFATQGNRMLIISYESFYKHINSLDKKCDLVIFDQGHRLKNRKSKLFVKLKLFSCKKRILLTGTPLQNNLEQLYSCISLVNPLLFQNEARFKNIFQKPIMAGITKNATKQQVQLCQARTVELVNRIKQFSLRRKADILQKYLPQKRQILVFFKLTPLQKMWYDRTLQIKQKQNQTQILSILNSLRKLFIHPQIFKRDCAKRNVWYNFNQKVQDEATSYKLSFTIDMIVNCVNQNEKIIIVSSYVQNLDYVHQILKILQVPAVQLDGRNCGKQRESIIEKFKTEKSVLLLSSKAGGTGLTLTCACRMIILQPDWNPSNDAQVMGRIWRQGQQKLLIISSFQQKILQRQHLKQALSEKLIDDKKQTRSDFDFLNLKQLFISNFQNCLTFSKADNKLKQYIQDELFPSEGVIHLQVIKSHMDQNQKNNRNQFENAQFVDWKQQQQTQLQDDQQALLDQQQFIKSNSFVKAKVLRPQDQLVTKNRVESEMDKNKATELIVDKENSQDIFTNETNNQQEEQWKQQVWQQKHQYYEQDNDKQGQRSYNIVVSKQDDSKSKVHQFPAALRKIKKFRDLSKDNQI